MSAHDARSTLHKLVDLAEERPPEERERRIQRRLQQRFDGPDAQDAYNRLLEQARDAGAVTLEQGKRELSHLYVKTYLADLALLYRFLGRIPDHEETAQAAEELERRASHLMHAGADLHALTSAWRAGRGYAGIARRDVADALDYLRALDAVLDGGFAGRDMRTISTRRLGDSKLLERQAPRVARALRSRGLADEAASDREALAAIGLEKFPPEVRLAGPVSVLGADMSGLVFTALPPEHVRDVQVPDGTPVVTIENLASFNRYVREARPPGELAVYTGGFPSSAVAGLLAAVGPRAGACHHWGDIDAAGLRIAADVGRHLGRLPVLWRMSPALARTHGSPEAGQDAGQLPEGAPDDYRGLAAFLSGPEAHVLEQEDLDPVSPNAVSHDIVADAET